MDFFLELFLTAFIALLFSFLIAKIVSLATGGGDSDSGVEEKSLIDVEELEFAEKLKVQGLESEKKVGLVKERAGKVDVIETGQVEVDLGLESEKRVECVRENAVKVEEFEAGEGELAERLKVQGFEGEKGVQILQETNKKADDDFEAEQAEVGEAEVGLKLDDIVVEKKMEKKDGKFGEEFEAENEAKLLPEEMSVEESRMKGPGEEEKGVKGESDDDDWEGIERSELQKVFGAAAKFVEHKGDLEGLGNDVLMELYGLHKIATEGPCHESQPLAFMVSSRSKWNAWQRLGNMDPDAAMEKYVALLSDRVPGWMEENSGEHKFESADGGVPGAMASDINSFPDQHTSFAQESNVELKSATVGGGITESTSSEKQAKD